MRSAAGANPALPAIVLAGPLALGLLLAAAEVSLREPRHPPPLSDGPFTVSAWYPARGMQVGRVVPELGGSGAMIKLTPFESAGGQTGSIVPKAGAASVELTPAAWPQDRGLAQLAGDGSMLLAAAPGGVARSATQPVAADGRRQLDVVLRRAGALHPAESRVAVRVPLESGRVLCTALPDGTVAAMCVRPDSYGRIELLLGNGSTPGRAVQEIDDAVVAGHALVDGQRTLAVLQRTGRLWVLDQRQQKLVADPSWEFAAAQALAVHESSFGLALSDGLLVVSTGSRVACFNRSGAKFDVERINPEEQLPSGKRRFRISLAEALPVSPAVRKNWWRAGVRRDGASAPLDRTAAQARLIPLADSCVVFADGMFNRVVCIRLSGAARQGSSSH